VSRLPILALTHMWNVYGAPGQFLLPEGERRDVDERVGLADVAPAAHDPQPAAVGLHGDVDVVPTRPQLAQISLPVGVARGVIPTVTAVKPADFSAGLASAGGAGLSESDRLFDRSDRHREEAAALPVQAEAAELFLDLDDRQRSGRDAVIWDDLADDHAVSAVVLTGAGDYFSVGGDVKAMSERPGGDVLEEGEPIGAAETIVRYVGKLVALLCVELEERGVGARRLDLVCHLVDNRVQAVRIGVAKPIRDPKRLTRLLCDKIETIDPGFGIEILRLAATAVEPLGTSQAISSLVEETAADVTGLVDILANRLGGRRLFRMAPAQSDVPERSFVRVSPTAPVSDEQWPSHWPRPSRLLSMPEPIQTVALLPDHPPVNFTWRGIRRRVKRADGPERVFGEWWKRDAELVAVRDYFQVEDEGGERFWIFRAGDGEDAATGSHRWFLHGIFG
jgi:hypothetical protein